MKNKKVRRKLIASFFFDLGTSINTMYMPTVSIYWNVGNKRRPFQMSIKYAWKDFVVDYPYKQMMRYLRGSSFTELAKHEITERIHDYKGDFSINRENEFYLSECGKSILASQNQEQVEKWISKKML